METYKNELDRIRTIIENFYVAKFASSQEEYKTNKINKEQIEQLIIRIKEARDLSEPEQQELVNEALRLLATNSGSAEDYEIAEQILDNLFYKLRIVAQEDVDYYYQFNAAGRWD